MMISSTAGRISHSTTCLGSRGRVFCALILAGVLDGACGPCKDRPESPTPGTYVVTDAPDPELLGGTAQIEDDLLTLTYTRSDGSRWLVTYRVGELF